MKPLIISRKYLRQNYLAQCLKGSGAKVEGGFVYVLVHLLQAGHYAQHYVRGAECDVRQYHGCESLRDTATDEQQEQRHARNDVRIHHRNGIGEVHHPARACAQVEDTDGRDAAQRRTGGGCQHGNGKGVPDGARQRVVHAAREEGAYSLVENPVQLPSTLASVKENTMMIRIGEYSSASSSHR